MDTYVFITLNGKQKSTPKQRSYYSEREKGMMKNVWMWATPLQCIHCMHGTKVGEQLADYLPCGGSVVTDQEKKKDFVKVGFSVLKREIFIMSTIIDGCFTFITCLLHGNAPGAEHHYNSYKSIH